MGSAVEAYNDFRVGHFNIGRGINDVPKEVSCLSVTVSSHLLGQASIEAAGDDQ